MEILIQENGKTTQKMGMEFLRWQLAIDMRATGLMARKMDKVNIVSQMGIYTKEISTMEIVKVKEFIHGLTTVTTKENGSMTK